MTGTSSPDVARPKPQSDGYLIVEKPAVAWNSHVQWLRNNGSDVDEWLTKLHATVAVDPTSYAGVDRHAVDPGLTDIVDCLPYELPKEYLAAGRRMRELLGPDPTTRWPWLHFDDSLLPTREAALRAFVPLAVSGAWEVVRMSRGPTDRTAHTLGFDVAIWSSQHVSIIRDALITASYHPAPEDEHEELARRTRRLNEHVLFDTAVEATAYRDWYWSRPWAEQIPPVFYVVRVDSFD